MLFTNTGNGQAFSARYTMPAGQGTRYWIISGNYRFSSNDITNECVLGYFNMYDASGNCLYQYALDNQAHWYVPGQAGWAGLRLGSGTGASMGTFNLCASYISLVPQVGPFATGQPYPASVYPAGDALCQTLQPITICCADGVCYVVVGGNQYSIAGTPNVAPAKFEILLQNRDYSGSAQFQSFMYASG